MTEKQQDTFADLISKLPEELRPHFERFTRETVFRGNLADLLQSEPARSAIIAIINSVK